MDINIDELLKSCNKSKYSVISKSDVRRLEINSNVKVRKKNTKTIFQGIIVHKTYFYHIIKVKNSFKTIQLNEYEFLETNDTEKFMNYLIESLDNDTIIDNDDH